MQRRILYAVSCTVLILAYSVIAHAITLSVSNEEGAPGDTVVVKINIDNTNGIASLGIKPFEYDANVLVVTEVKATPLIAGLALQTSNTDTPGVINVAAVGFAPLGDGSGAIYEITFEVKADAPAGKSPLTIGQAPFSDLLGNILEVTIENGEFTVTGGVEPIPPQPVITPPGDVIAGQEVEFDGSGSTDADGAIATWQWDFGDGNTGEGEKAKNTYANAGTYTVKLTVTDDGGLSAETEVEVTVGAQLPEIIKVHEVGSPMLALEVDFMDEQAASCSVKIWAGELVVEPGMYLEYQCTLASGNPTFNAGIEIQTSDGALLSAEGKDQNDLGAGPTTDLSTKIKVGDEDIPVARDRWYHREISLDSLEGQTLSQIILATDSGAHRQGQFRFYVDNVQITNGEGRLMAIFIDGEDGNDILTGQDEVTEGESAGSVENCMVKVGEVEIAVHPAGKLPTTWGKIKKLR